MAPSEAVRRIKTYSAATGFVYQYQFHDVQKAKHDGADGTDYIYYVSVDRKNMFLLRVSVRQDAVREFSLRTGRVVSGTEEYAVAKMRLFQAFDEVEDLATLRPELVVDGSNLESLIERLDLF